jgi:hypothetical protein
VRPRALRYMAKETPWQGTTPIWFVGEIKTS